MQGLEIFGPVGLISGAAELVEQDRQLDPHALRHDILLACAIELDERLAVGQVISLRQWQRLSSQPVDVEDVQGFDNIHLSWV